MKTLGNVLLYVFAALAAFSGLYVILSPGAMSAEDVWSPNKAPVTIIIWVALLALVLSIVLFILFKIIDIIKHPSHTKEFFYVAGAVIIALIIGFIFSGNGDIVYGNGEVYEAGVISKLIGTGLIATLVLLISAIAYMAFDTIRGLLKS